ncbi:hypothetical protein Taro_000774 [Colocasia esculenta]|uniref:Transposase-associated domain-containing protein n=1 Tax=Colocasia esculenta TaxID=4460 RepID=A0A843TG60_COLES|nr:hypothetical protein [Colocasia esculenta]
MWEEEVTIGRQHLPESNQLCQPFQLHRVSDEYKAGINKFLDYAFQRTAIGEKILCPCNSCNNCLLMFREDVVDHLICEGFTQNYTCWYFHGERMNNSMQINTQNQGHDKYNGDHEAMYGVLEDGIQDTSQLQLTSKSRQKNSTLHLRKIQSSRALSGTHTREDLESLTQPTHVEEHDDHLEESPSHDLDNNAGKPVGPNARKLANYLGTIARNPQKAPLTWGDWRKMPIEYKNHMWDLVKQRSAMNKLNREKQIVGHTTGSKSFAMIRKEIRQKRDDARNPSRAELFNITHTRKDGHPVNEESARVMGMLQEVSSPKENTSPKTMKDDLLSQVLGKDKPGRIRMLGLGPTPSSVYGPVPTRAQALQMAHDGNASPSIHSSASSHEVQHHNVQRGLKKRGRNDDNVNVQGKAMVYLKSFKKSLVNVALATIESKDPLKKVGGCDLGCEYWEVAINVALVYNEPLPRPYGQFKTIGDAIGETIAWLFTLAFIVAHRSFSPSIKELIF